MPTRYKNIKCTIDGCVQGVQLQEPGRDPFTRWGWFYNHRLNQRQASSCDGEGRGFALDHESSLGFDNADCVIKALMIGLCARGFERETEELDSVGEG